MAIFKLNLKRLFKDKMNLFFIVLMPILSIIIASIFVVGQEQKIRVGFVANSDYTSKLLISEMGKFFDVAIINKNTEKYNLIFNNYECIVSIDPDFKDKLLKRQKPEIKIYTFSKTGYHVFVKEHINSIVNIFSQISLSSKNESEFKKKLSEYGKIPILLYTNTNKAKDNTSSLSLIIGFLIVSLISLTIHASSILLKDREERTLLRILCSVKSSRTYILQSVFSIFIVVLFQILFYIGIMKLIYHNLFAKGLVNSLFVFLISALLFVSLALLIISMLKNSNQLGVVMPILTTILPMLGGCYWPLDIMPNFMQKISLLVPTTYVMNASKAVVVLGKDIMAVRNDIFAIILFSILFILLSIRNISRNIIEKLD